MNTPDTLIIGAGPAGMSCAMELHRAGRACTIVERDDQVGGLAKTLVFHEDGLEFRTDIGPHRFFSKNQYLYDFIESLLGEDWAVVNRKTRQLIDGKFYDYPINAGQAAKNIGLANAFLMGLSYLGALVQYKVLRKPVVSFEDYIVSNFGRRLGEFNMLNYTEKIWGLPCSRIHPDWARQRIKGLNMVSALKSALAGKGSKGKPKTLVDQFFYPRTGTGAIYETIADRIREGGSELHLNSRPTALHHADGVVRKVELQRDGEAVSVTPARVVSSIPVCDMLRLLRPAPPAEVLDAAASLKWRAQVYVFLTLDKPSVTDDNWIYFPTRSIPFGRVAEMRNFSPIMSPPGKTSLFVEYFVTEGDEIWRMPEQELTDLTIRHFEELNLFTRGEVRQSRVLRRTEVYPVYDLDYLDNLGRIMPYLDGFANLICIGRPGRFKYTNQDHSLEMGIAAAMMILQDRKIDLDAIGSEDEYFEKGVLNVPATPPA